MNEQTVQEALRRSGPMTGSRLLELTRLDVLPLWRLCRNSPSIRWGLVGQRYVRLDRAVEGYARLSPSIRREFLTYTVLGLPEQEPAMNDLVRTLRGDIRQISRDKHELARFAIASALSGLPDEKEILQRTTFLIAGDIVYDMAHRVPRPEHSTGEMVNGSDLDVIAVVEDGMPEAVRQRLDEAIHRKKHYLMVHPEYREELDYLVKDFARVREQLKFDAFESMIASKILQEGRLLCGSPVVFRTLKQLVEDSGVPKKLEAMEARARDQRRQAEERLLDEQGGGSEFLNLFFTSEEGDEIY